MKIRDIMTTKLATAQPETTLEEIATMMRTGDVGAIPIADGDELVGIITDRDIVVRCIAEGKDPSEACAEDILVGDVATIDPESEVDKAAEIMSRQQIRRLPVVENGRLIGIVSIGDIAVKQKDDRVSGDALEGVSRGVKHSTAGKNVKAASKKAPAKHLNTGEGSKPQRTARDQNETAQGQGISNHNLSEERGRQARVVPIRAEGKSGKIARPASRFLSALAARERGRNEYIW